MVNVVKDVREWDINIILDHRECGYVFYPNNIHACSYHGRETNGEYIECTLEDCPLKI